MARDPCACSGMVHMGGGICMHALQRSWDAATKVTTSSTSCATHPLFHSHCPRECLPRTWRMPLGTHIPTACTARLCSRGSMCGRSMYFLCGHTLLHKTRSPGDELGPGCASEHAPCALSPAHSSVHVCMRLVCGGFRLHSCCCLLLHDRPPPVRLQRVTRRPLALYINVAPCSCTV